MKEVGILPGQYKELTELDQFLEGHNGFIAGGIFKDIFRGQKIRDVDIWFRTEEDYEQAVAYYTMNPDYDTKFINENAVGFKVKNKDYYIEVIKRRIGTPRQILDSFDYTVCKAAYFKRLSARPNEDAVLKPFLMHHDNFFSDLKRNILIREGRITEPIKEFERLLKYSRYGFHPCKEYKESVLLAIRSLEELPEITETFEFDYAEEAVQIPDIEPWD